MDTPTDAAVVLATAAQVAVQEGDQFDTHPHHDKDDLLVIDEVSVVRRLVHELATADLSPGVVLPVLGGLTLSFRDANGSYLGSVGVLAPGWLRGWWTSDALLPESLSLLRDDSHQLLQYLRAGRDAVDAATPGLAAARDSNGIEHALGDGRTLCGLPRTEVEVLRHHFMFRAHNCPDCYRIAWQNNDKPLWPKMFDGAVNLSAGWAARWGTIPPVGHLLRGGDSWVRFHSLPASKRYAETSEEHSEVLRRHHTTLRELAGKTGSGEVLVLTLSWSRSSRPVPQDAPLQAALPTSGYWSSFQDPADPQNDVWNHVFVNRLPLTATGLDPLLLLAADGTAEVVICDVELTWFFHPYDGGADIIVATTAQRDELKERHADWLPTNEAGL